MREQFERHIGRFLGRRSPEAAPSPSTRPSELRQSVFGQMGSEDLSLLGELASGASSERISNLLDQFGIHGLDTMDEQAYAISYITVANGYNADQARLADPDLTQAEKDDITSKMHSYLYQYTGMEILLDQSKRLTKERMEEVRDDAEISYRMTLAARVNEKEYPLDVENSAIPVVEEEQLAPVVIAALEATDWMMGAGTSAYMRDKEKILAEEKRKIDAGVPIEVIEQDTTAYFNRAIMEESQIPQSVLSVLSVLNLHFDNPLHIKYALGYLVLAEQIKAAISREQELELRKDFARFEAGLGVTRFKMTREEMTYVRQAVEEAFRARPEALSTLEVVQAPTSVDQEEFEEITSQIQAALNRAAEDITKASPTQKRLINRFQEVCQQIEESKAKASKEKNTQFLNQLDNLGSALGGLGVAFSSGKGPEILKLYRRINPTGQLPLTVREFIDVLVPERIQKERPFAFKVAGVSLDEVNRFARRINEAELERLTPAQLGRLMMQVMQMTEIVQKGLGIDFASKTDVRRLEDLMGMTPEEKAILGGADAARGTLIVARVVTLLLGYVHSDTLKKFEELLKE